MPASIRILAIASAGGHWHQLCQLCASLRPEDIHYATTIKGLPEKAGFQSFSITSDCNRNTPLKMVFCALQIFFLLLRRRPHVIITTGAMPGLIAIAVGRVFRCRTIWIDSIANAEEASSSGRIAKRFASLWLSQWEHVAESEGGRYEGSLF